MRGQQERRGGLRGPPLLKQPTAGSAARPPETAWSLSRGSDHAAGAKGTETDSCALSRSHSSAAERTVTSAFAAGSCTALTVAGKRLAAEGVVSAIPIRTLATNGKRSSGLRTLDARFGDKPIALSTSCSPNPGRSACLCRATAAPMQTSFRNVGHPARFGAARHPARAPGADLRFPLEASARSLVKSSRADLAPGARPPPTGDAPSCVKAFAPPTACTHRR
jgi:hypothetical protein